MKNNEIQSLVKRKNEKEKFYILRNEIVRNSCKDIKEQVDEYKKHMKYAEEKNPAYKAFLFDPSVRNNILMDLENGGFNLNEIGTQYLATLITMYFHERKLFRRKDLENNGYFDLSLHNNEHYSMLGTTPDQARYKMDEAISHSSEWYDASIPEVVYTLADNYMYMYREDGDEKNIPYAKKLLKQ